MTTGSGPTGGNSTYTSRTFRILIASPSDVEEEREIAVRVIQEWNDLYSHTRKVVLLPLRWETHTAPEYGVRPQEVINRAIVDSCDLLVGIFWTRIGTPTGAADSGTLEEIERVASAGKPVMLYFSRVGADPNTLDLGQLSRLAGFREKTYPNALTESFKSQIEFRDKFAKQLELKVRDLQRADDAGQPLPLEFGFASRDTKTFTAREDSCTVDVLDVLELHEFLERESSSSKDALLKEAQRRIQRAATVPALLGIRNVTASGIRNLYIELSITASNEKTQVFDRAPHRGSWFASHIWSMSFGEIDLSDDDEPAYDPWEEALRHEGETWRLAVELDALQPQRVRFIKPRLFVNATTDSTLHIHAKIFADSFAEPISLDALLRIHATRRHLSAAELLPDLERLKAKIDAHARPLTVVT